jgi:hypothetical protein
MYKLYLTNYMRKDTTTAIAIFSDEEAASAAYMAAEFMCDGINGDCILEDTDTGEIVKEFHSCLDFGEEEEDYDDCDYEMGYDPYLGCFSDDC